MPTPDSPRVTNNNEPRRRSTKGAEHDRAICRKFAHTEGNYASSKRMRPGDLPVSSPAQTWPSGHGTIPTFDMVNRLVTSFHSLMSLTALRKEEAAMSAGEVTFERAEIDRLENIASEARGAILERVAAEFPDD